MEMKTIVFEKDAAIILTKSGILKISFYNYGKDDFMRIGGYT